MRKFWADSKGATAIEYGLIVGLVVIAAVVGISSLGNGSSGSLSSTANKVTDAMK